MSATHCFDMPQQYDVLQIGITTKCNQLCLHCPRETRYEGMSTMELEAFSHYLDQFDPKKFKRVLVSDFGEITIIPPLLDYLRTVKAKGFEGVHFVTNATRLDREFWQTIADERLVSYLIISFEAAEDPLYKEIRGHNFSHFSAVVDMISTAFNRAEPPIPFMMNGVCMVKNLNQIEKMVEFTARVRATELNLVHLNPTAYANQSPEKICIPSQHLDSHPRAETLKVFARVIERAKALGVRLLLPEPFPEITAPPPPRPPVAANGQALQLRCDKPFKWIQVNLDGELFPCCQMSQRLSMGNLGRASFAEIWNGERYAELLNGLLPGNTPLEVCRECNILKGKRF